VTEVQQRTHGSPQEAFPAHCWWQPGVVLGQLIKIYVDVVEQKTRSSNEYKTWELGKGENFLAYSVSST